MKKCRFFQVGLCSFLIFLLSALHVSACSVGVELGDFVWNDLNRNGIQDPSEPGIIGIDVRLFVDGNNNSLGSTTTDSDGWYKFTGLQLNTYLVEFSAPAGFDFTVAKIGGDQYDSDVKNINLSIGIGRTDPILIATAGDYDEVADAGMSQVPLPAAAWLLGSGLIGLLGLRRRFKS